jgi:hypothetical protein
VIIIDNAPYFPTPQDDETALRRALAEAQDALEAWQTCAMQFLDAVQRGMAHYSAEDPRTTALAHDAEIFLRAAAPCGFWRLMPAPGDPVVEEEVQVIGAQPSPDYPPHSVLTCIAWGYRIGDTVLQRATVILVAPDVPVSGGSA